MIILIGGEKGGTGKSTIAKNLATYWQAQHKDILAVDTDPQATFYNWCERRKTSSHPPILCTKLTGGKIAGEIQSLSKRYGLLIIDAGGQDSKALRAAMTVATHLLVPAQPSFSDLETLVHMSNIVDDVQPYNPNLIVRSIITRCPTLPSQFNDILGAKDYSISIGIQPLNAITSQRAAYNAFDHEGSTAYESGNDKARQEIEEIATEMTGIVP